MSKFGEFIESKKYLLLGILGALLISMTLKTQAVVLTYGDNYSLKMEYTVYGFCIRASAALKETEPAVSGAVYIGSSIDASINKAVEQLEKLTDEKHEIGLFASGYPRNNEKLEQHLKTMLEESGRTVKLLNDK